jgi:hypothetical protein
MIAQRPLDTLRTTLQHSIMLTYVLIGAASGAVSLGIVGFVFGAGVADERAGEAAILLGKIGAALGLALGLAAGAGLFWAFH